MSQRLAGKEFMMNNDPISDMLTRIRNAIGVNKTDVSVPYSKIKESIALILKNNNYISGVTSEGEGINKTLIISLRLPETNAKISSLKRLSTPGRRVYANVSNIPKVKQGRGIIIISTSKGIMTGSEAQNQKLGGELICEVY